MKRFLVPSIIMMLCVTASAGEDVFRLDKPGVNGPVDYRAYGVFEKAGTAKYAYRVTDRRGLVVASGEGVYPDWKSVFRDPSYRQLKRQGRLDGTHWSHVDTGDPLADFFVWTAAHEEYGVKQFFIAQALEEAGLFMQAVKAYYAVVVFFPRSPCWGADRSFVWYVGPEAVQRIQQILNLHPELNIELKGAKITVKGGKDTNLSNDVITVNPGRFVAAAGKKEKTRLGKVVERRGEGSVHAVKYENGHWELRVDGKRAFVKGISYMPSPVGSGPTETDAWMHADSDGNGRIDGPYDSWVDENRNGRQDRDEDVAGDFALLKAMGCNAIRYYHSSSNETYVPEEYNRGLLRDLYQRFGIRVLMGDFLGAYTIGSGADWNAGTDYTDSSQRQQMKESVRAMVLDHKDEPYVLMWILGNENNMPADFSGVNATRTNAAEVPVVYAKFLNEVARMIHGLDPDHPVAVGNLETNLLEYYARYAEEIDIVAVNSYRGKRGFGSLWSTARSMFDRPILILEYGCDAYAEQKGLDEQSQKVYHQGCWEDIVGNRAGSRGIGNAVGGVVFEWLDEWWKDTHSGDSVDNHQTAAQSRMPFPDGWSHEEWLGIAGQGDGQHSPFLRELRQVYYYYKHAWNK